MIEIVHTAADGSLLLGTFRSDGSNEILKPLGWRWSRNLDAWYLPKSRDQVPATPLLEETADRLRAAGHAVELAVDPTRRAPHEIETDRKERQEARAASLTSRAERAATEAELADDRARAISAHIPLGQPVLIDHHSAPRHLRDLARIDRAHTKAADSRALSRELTRRAGAAAEDTAGRYNPQTVARRIGALEIQLRKLDRTLTGYTNHLRDTFPPAEGTRKQRTEAEIAEVTEQLEYWRGIRDTQIRDGAATNYSRGDVAAGDQVQYRGGWHTVIRVNAKSVSIRSQVGGSWTDTIPYAEVTNHRTV